MTLRTLKREVVRIKSHHQAAKDTQWLNEDDIRLKGNIPHRRWRPGSGFVSSQVILMYSSKGFAAAVGSPRRKSGAENKEVFWLP